MPTWKSVTLATLQVLTTQNPSSPKFILQYNTNQTEHSIIIFSIYVSRTYIIDHMIVPRSFFIISHQFLACSKLPPHEKWHVLNWWKMIDDYHETLIFWNYMRFTNKSLQVEIFKSATVGTFHLPITLLVSMCTSSIHAHY